MISIYRKKEKSRDNLLGIEEIKEISELEKPFLLCLSAQDLIDNSVYGIIKIGAEAARVNTSEEMAAGFKIDDFPVDFLGLSYKGEESKKVEEILDNLIIPYLFIGDDKSVEFLEKRARNINFMTFCDGAITYVELEKLIVEKLVKMGYSKENVKSIISQISLTAIGTSVDTSKLDATTVKIVDVNDDEIETEESIFAKQRMDTERVKSVYGLEEKSNNVSYYYDGSGEHVLKEYLKDGVFVKPVLCSAVSYFLLRSIEKFRISSDAIIKQFELYGNDSIDPRNLIDYLDTSLSYKGAPRYSVNESKLRKELDESYKELYKTRRELNSEAKHGKEYEKKVRDLVETIKEYSSDTTFNQIMSKLGLWNIKGDYSDLPSDKEIRALYEANVSNKTL